MTTKTSTEKVSPHKIIGDDLNYEFVYNYDKNYAHRLVNIGNRYYKYDSNGNIICEQEGAFEDSEEIVYRKVTEEAENVYSTDYGWGLFKEEIGGSSNSVTRYKRTYSWNEKNQLISSVDDSYSTSYVYGQDGQRSNKYTANSETLYFNKMWTLHTDSGNSIYGGQYAKNIYLGETRIVTKLNSGNNPTYQEEYYKLYFYHSDHLGSASLISDYKGDEYQRIEYTPYGETWVEKTSNTGLEYLPYKFTAKEQDEETGLYYYGARYLDPKYSMWISTDPALGEYIPQAPINDEAKKNNQNLPGMGGIFNTVNLNLYHYAANNPVKYTDPDGNDIKGVFRGLVNMVSAGFEVAGGVFLMGGAAAGEIGSVGLATPAAVAVGVVGFAAFVDGMANFAFAAADFAVELADCFTDDTSVDGDLLPANTGGAIGSGIDQQNGFDAQKEHKKGPAQIKGENINGAVSLGLTTSGYLGSVVEAASTQAPASASQVVNEVSHQYDIYNNTKLMLEKED